MVEPIIADEAEGGFLGYIDIFNLPGKPHEGASVSSLSDQRRNTPDDLVTGLGLLGQVDALDKAGVVLHARTGGIHSLSKVF